MISFLFSHDDGRTNIYRGPQFGVEEEATNGEAIDTQQLKADAQYRLLCLGMILSKPSNPSNQSVDLRLKAKLVLVWRTIFVLPLWITLCFARPSDELDDPVFCGWGQIMKIYEDCALWLISRGETESLWGIEDYEARVTAIISILTKRLVNCLNITACSQIHIWMLSIEESHFLLSIVYLSGYTNNCKNMKQQEKSGEQR